MRRQNKPEPKSLRVSTRLEGIEDPDGAANLFQRMLEAVRMAQQRRLREEKERSNDDTA